MDTNTYDVGQAISLSALFLTGVTVGQMNLNQTTVYVRDPSGLTLTPGSPILIKEAGYAGGDLLTTVVSSSGQAIVVADPCRAYVSLMDVGSPTNPSDVTLLVQTPNGQVDISDTLENPSAGRWVGFFDAATDGDHYYRFIGTGAAEADTWRKFIVRPERVPES